MPPNVNKLLFAITLRCVRFNRKRDVLLLRNIISLQWSEIRHVEYKIE